MACLVLSYCEKQDNQIETKFSGDVFPIKIETNKTWYTKIEPIPIEIVNTSDSLAMYYTCSSYEGIPPNVYKLTNGEWTAYWVPMCDGFMSFCCPSFFAGESYKDTLDIDFNTGTYRLEYQFIVRPGHEYKSFFSNSFDIR